MLHLQFFLWSAFTFLRLTKINQMATLATGRAIAGHPGCVVLTLPDGTPKGTLIVPIAALLDRILRHCVRWLVSQDEIAHVTDGLSNNQQRGRCLRSLGFLRLSVLLHQFQYLLPIGRRWFRWLKCLACLGAILLHPICIRSTLALLGPEITVLVLVLQCICCLADLFAGFRYPALLFFCPHMRLLLGKDGKQEDESRRGGNILRILLINSCGGRSCGTVRSINDNDAHPADTHK